MTASPWRNPTASSKSDPGVRARTRARRRPLPGRDASPPRRRELDPYQGVEVRDPRLPGPSSPVDQDVALRPVDLEVAGRDRGDQDRPFEPAALRREDDPVPVGEPQPGG